MNMITVTLQYGDNYVDVEFPCSDNYLQSRLNELHYPEEDEGMTM